MPHAHVSIDTRHVMSSIYDVSKGIPVISIVSYKVAIILTRIFAIKHYHIYIKESLKIYYDFKYILGFQ